MHLCGTNAHHIFKVEDADHIEAVKASSISSNKVGKEEKPIHQDSTKEVRPQKTGFKRISPAAKLLISEHKLDASSIPASGPHGTLSKGDVLAAIKSGKGSSKISSGKEAMPSSPQTHPQTASSESVGLKSDLKQPDSYEDFPNSQIRKVIYYIKLILGIYFFLHVCLIYNDQYIFTHAVFLLGLFFSIKC